MEVEKARTLEVSDSSEEAKDLAAFSLGFFKEKSWLMSSFKEVFNGNGNLLTLLAVSLILFSGVAIVDGKDNWWIIALCILVLFVGVFLLLNVRVVIKSAVTVVATLFMASGAFQIGTFSDPYGIAGLLWMGMAISLFFLSMAYTYAFQGPKSRWSCIFFSQTVSFLTTASMIISLYDRNVSVATGFVVGVLALVVSYTLLGRIRYRPRTMPFNDANEEVISNILDFCSESDWNGVLINNKKSFLPKILKKRPINNYPEGDILLWKDRAYLYHPVRMNSPFGSSGRGKRVSVSYEKRSITPWLHYLVYTRIPVWRTKGSDITLVVFDLNRRNGSDVKLIALPIPDSKRVIPVVVAPAPKTFNRKSIESVLGDVDSMLSDVKIELSDKQLKALSRTGVFNDEETTEKSEESHTENESAKS